MEWIQISVTEGNLGNLQTTYMHLVNTVLRGVSYKIPHTVLFHLYKMSKIKKSIETENRCGCQGLGD